MRPLNFVLGILVGTIFSSALVIAWTGPTSAPPNGNVSAPINVGTVLQEKQGIFGARGILNTGSISLLGSNRYLTFDSPADSSGYGIRDNAGTLQFKNNGGAWRSMVSTSTSFAELSFADGTVQTTAASTAYYDSGWFTVTTASNVNKIGSFNRYVINHNFNSKNVTVTVYVKTSTGEEMIVESFHYFYFAPSSAWYCMGYVVSDITLNSLEIGTPRIGCNNYLFYPSAPHTHESMTTGQFRVIVQKIY